MLQSHTPKRYKGRDASGHIPSLQKAFSNKISYKKPIKPKYMIQYDTVTMRKFKIQNII